jgi:hypothetical protein
MIMERGIERRFSCYGGVICFCKELINGGLEGLYDCVVEGVIEDKGGICLETTCGSSQIHRPSTSLKWLLKMMQEDYPERYKCSCYVDATDMVIEWRETYV